MAEVLTGPLAKGQEVLAKRYRGVMESWQVVELSADIAESAARIRADVKLKLADAVQLASALAIGADALVTHDRDFFLGTKEIVESIEPIGHHRGTAGGGFEEAP